MVAESEVEAEAVLSVGVEDTSLADDVGSIEAPEAEIVVASPWRDFVRRFVGNRSAMIGLVIILTLCIVAIFAPWIAPHPFAQQDLMNSLNPPLSESLPPKP